MDKTAKILVIEDDPISQHVAIVLLESMDYLVTATASGKHALSIYHNFDLIVSDANLPDITGLKICENIRSQNNKSDIPMIALTANYDNETLYKNAGFNIFLKKPVNYELLKSSIEELLKH